MRYSQWLKRRMQKLANRLEAQKMELFAEVTKPIDLKPGDRVKITLQLQGAEPEPPEDQSAHAGQDPGPSTRKGRAESRRGRY